MKVEIFDNNSLFTTGLNLGVGIPIGHILISFLNMDIASIKNKGIIELVNGSIQLQKHNPEFTRVHKLINELLIQSNYEKEILVAYEKILDDNEDIDSLIKSRAKKGRIVGGMGVIFIDEESPEYISSNCNNLEEFQEIVSKFVEDIFVYKKFHYTFKFYTNAIVVEEYSLKNKNDHYEINNVEELIQLCLSKLWDKDIEINKCENCGDYFLPRNRSDEVYCDKLYSKNKTCKDIGYINKLKSDKGLKEYRREYKRRNAIASRKKSSIAAEVWEKWKTKASENRELYKKGEMSLEEFLEWLKK